MPSSFAFRLLSKDSIPDAIKKAERYRLLGEPDEAESVCFDILQVDPDNQEARVDLILAISDQFGREPATGRRRAVAPAWGAMATACTRVRTPSLARMWETWTDAVFSLMKRAAATCLFVRPSARRRSTSSSRGVSASSGPGAAAAAL